MTMSLFKLTSLPEISKDTMENYRALQFLLNSDRNISISLIDNIPMDIIRVYAMKLSV